MADDGRSALPILPRWPKPHIFKRGGSWMVVFTNPRYPHTRYFTGFLHTIREAWAHLPVMMEYHGVPATSIKSE